MIQNNPAAAVPSTTASNAAGTAGMASAPASSAPTPSTAGMPADVAVFASIADQKKQLRSQLKKQRKNIPADQRASVDATIAQNVVALEAFQQADLLLPYLSFGSEVRTHEIIQAAWDAGKTVALPWCVPGTRSMRWLGVSSLDDLVQSPLGVLEPDPERAPLILGENDAAPVNSLALVPGLTFDPQGFRLGYGGGFYDVFLSSFAGTSVGLCREQQMCEAVPFLDAHDLPVDLVVTDQHVLRAGEGRP